jgi:hypothetical protein
MGSDPRRLSGVTRTFFTGSSPVSSRGLVGRTLLKITVEETEVVEEMVGKYST